jgi:hypothetical protein
VVVTLAEQISISLFHLTLNRHIRTRRLDFQLKLIRFLNEADAKEILVEIGGEQLVCDNVI